MELYAPKEYWHLSKEERTAICNGCGSKDGIKVPDTMYGMCVLDICNIHDYMYHIAQTLADKLFADAIFRMNLSIKIDDYSSNGFMRMLRHMRAGKYYSAVAQYGDSAFWVNKIKNDNMYITYKGEFR